MAKPGQNKGNRNAALPAGQRRRVNFTVSVSGESLLKLVQYIQVTPGSDEVTDEEVAQAVRAHVEEWIDTLTV